MGDYDATLLGAIAQYSPIDREKLFDLYCAFDEPEVTSERSAKFDDRLRFLANLGFVTVDGDSITYVGSL